MNISYLNDFHLSEVRLMGFAPWTLALFACLAAGALFFYARYLRRVGFSPAAVPIVLRALAFAAVLVLLANPVTYVENKRPVPRRVAFLMDASQSMGPISNREKPPRYTAALSAAARIRDALDTEHIWHFRFSDKAAPAAPAELQRLRPLGRATNIIASLARADTGEGLPLTDIVVFSDGRDTGGFEPAHDPALPRAHTVGFGPVRPDVNLAVGAIQSPDTAYVKQPVIIDGDLHAAGIPKNTEALVQLLDGNRRLASAVVKIRDKKLKGYRFRLTFTPQSAGLLVLTVKASSGAEEDTAADNTRTVFLDVVSGDRKILVADAPRPDHAFLVRFLRKQEKVDIKILIFTKIGTHGSEKRGALNADKLDDFALVVAGAMPGATAAERDALYRYAERGGAVVLLGGDNTIFGQGGAWSRAFSKTGAPPDKEPFTPRLTAAGRDDRLVRVAPNPGASADRWAALPRMRTFNPIAAGKSAEILAEHPRALCGKSRCPLIVRARIGRGRVLMLPFQGMWRWQLTRRPTDTFDKFWTNVLSWLLEPEDTRPVRLSLPDRYYELGEKVCFEARIDASVTNQNKPQAVITTMDGKQTATLNMKKKGQGGEFFEACWKPGNKGVFRVRVRTGSDASSAEPFDVDIARAEYLLTSQNAEFLKKTATASGGIYVDNRKLDELISLLKKPGRLATVRTEINLYKKPWCWYILGIIMSLLVAEWLVRRRGGLT